MATLRLHFLGDARAEIAYLREGEVPHWAMQLYFTHGVTRADRAPVSAAVEALARELQHRLKRMATLLERAERMGWVIEIQEHEILLHTGLDPLTSELRLEQEGVWTIARIHAPRDAAGRVLWDEGAGREPQQQGLDAAGRLRRLGRPSRG